MQHHELKLDSRKADLTVEGHRLNNLPVSSMPWRPCTNLCFFLLNINYRQIKSTQLLHCFHFTFGNAMDFLVQTKFLFKSNLISNMGLYE